MTAKTRDSFGLFITIASYGGFLAFVWWDSGVRNALAWLAFFVVATYWISRPENFRPY